MRKPLLKVKDAARLLNVAPITLYRQIRQGKLPCLKIGTEFRLDEAECRAHFRQSVKKES